MNKLIVEWLQARNLIKGSTSKDQLCKLIQEVGEVSDAICKGDINNLQNEIGDCIVVLTAIAEQNGLTIENCTYSAYSKIKDRKGVMRDGIFIKEEDNKEEPALVKRVRAVDPDAADALIMLSSTQPRKSVDLNVKNICSSFAFDSTPQRYEYWERVARLLGDW